MPQIHKPGAMNPERSAQALETIVKLESRGWTTIYRREGYYVRIDDPLSDVVYAAIKSAEPILRYVRRPPTTEVKIYQFGRILVKMVDVTGDSVTERSEISIAVLGDTD